LTGMSLREVTPAALPGMRVLIAALLVMAYVPWVSLFLVGIPG
jgi:TRAP-type C4-dicarboxylate transport system permease large subunit